MRIKLCWNRQYSASWFDVHVSRWLRYAQDAGRVDLENNAYMGLSCSCTAPFAAAVAKPPHNCKVTQGVVNKKPNVQFSHLLSHQVAETSREFSPSLKQ